MPTAPRPSAHHPDTGCSPGQQIYRSTGGGGGAFEGPGGPSFLKPGTTTLGDMLKGEGYRTGVFGKWHVGLTWLDKDGKKLGGEFENSLLIDYEKSNPLFPALRSGQWLFQKPPAKSKFLAVFL